MKQKIAILGAGNLGLSLVKGLVESREYSANGFHLSRRRVEKLNQFKKEGYQVTDNNITATLNANIIILAVLPQKINIVLKELKGKLNNNQLIISLVSGVTIAEIKEIIGSNTPIVRAMPNTAISIRESMTCISTEHAWEGQISIVEKLFNLVGQTAIINEEKMTSATALCACGIAFFLRAIRAASQGGNEIDFHASEALKMAAQTAKGAALLAESAQERNEDPAVLRQKVTSPGGTTEAALKVMNENKMGEIILKALAAARDRGRELSKGK